MSIKLYQLYCEICNWKKITDGSDIGDMVEVKTSPIPGGVPKIDKETKKVVVPKTQKQTRRFKCPKCGRLVKPRKIANPQEIIDNKNELKERMRLRDEKSEFDGREDGIT